MCAILAMSLQHRAPHRRFAPLIPALLVAPFALSVGYTADFGLAYRGGLEAWTSGHPQRLVSWTAMPFLAVPMATITRLASEETAARVFMVTNLVIWAALLIVVWGRLDGRVPSRWWWGTLIAAGAFAPTITNVFWLQPDLIVLVLALGGFVLIGRHEGWAVLLIGLSIALKPLLVLLPFVLLIRRQSRCAGVWSIAIAGALSVVGLGFLAWRARDFSLMNPVAYFAAFLNKGGGPIFGCVPENYSPAALLCRLGLATSWATNFTIAACVLLITWLLVRRVPDATGPQWEVLGAAGLLSTLIGPIEWLAYWVALAPLLLLLAYQFWTGRAPARLWIGLVVAYVLMELVWDPLESLARTPVPIVVASYTIGQFAQYALLLVWIRWRLLRREAASSTSPVVQSRTMAVSEER
jgi:hypothetical protein